MSNKSKRSRDAAPLALAAYSRASVAWVRHQARKLPGFKSVSHIRPRAYCVAKPAPGCAVFATPWMDAEPLVRTSVFSGSDVVREGVYDIQVGDWCALAYVCTHGCGQPWAFKIPAEATGLGAV